MTKRKSPARPRASKPKAARETVAIKYHIGDAERSREIAIPLRSGAGEHLLNAVEREGCTDIPEVRAQLQNLPHSNERK